MIVPFPRTWQLEGGHKTQERATARALRRRGCDVVIGSPELAHDDFDIIHFFGDPNPVLKLGISPKARFFVTPIYFPSRVGTARFPHGAGLRAELQSRARGGLARAMRRRPSADHRARVAEYLGRLGRADVLIVNSSAEGRLLRSDWSESAPIPPIRVAYSGVEEEFFSGDAAQGRALVGLDDFVLCVGRIEPIKNQLALCQAMAGLDIPLVLIGATLPGNEPYRAACRTALPELVVLEHVDHDLLPNVYAASRVHALVSWFETTGLATLEAIASGTPAVASDIACVREYFSKAVRLVHPGRSRSIRSAIKLAMEGPTGRERSVASEFSWEATADQLLAIYAEAPR